MTKGTGKESSGGQCPYGESQLHAVNVVGSALQCCGQSITDPPHTKASSGVMYNDLEASTGLTATDALLAPAEDGTAEIIVTNATPLPQMIEEDTNLGLATPTLVADPSSLLPHPEEEMCEEDLDTLVADDLSFLEPQDPFTVRRVDTQVSVADRKERLLELVPETHPQLVPEAHPGQREQLQDQFTNHLEECEQGETDDAATSQHSTWHQGIGRYECIKIPVRNLPS